MKKTVKEQAFVKKPYYEGGDKAFGEFIMKNLQYPKEAFEQRVEGTVTVKYDIDYKGNVMAAKVISGIGFGCDEEAIRVVKLLKFMVPKQNQSLKVVFHKTTYIRFALDKNAFKQLEQEPSTSNPTPMPSFTVQYEITSSSQPTTSGNSYSYTVSI